MNAQACPWRSGRSVGRTIYAVYTDPVTGEEASTLIGVMDTPALAAEAVAAHNDRRRRVLGQVTG